MATLDDEVLYEGERGPGKTDALLMDFAQFVGRGFGRAWRGILFREEAIQLKDVIEKSLTWFPRMFRGARFIGGGDAEWRFAGGESLMFRHGRRVQDYFKYHGGSFCIAVGEQVLTPDGAVSIEAMRPGMLVETPSGPRRVTRVFPIAEKDCLEVEFFDSCWRSVGTQRQSVDHQLLTIGEAPSQWSGCSSCTRERPDEDQCQRRSRHRPGRDEHRGIPWDCACGGTLSANAEVPHRSLYRLCQKVGLFVRRHAVWLMRSPSSCAVPGTPACGVSSEGRGSYDKESLSTHRERPQPPWSFAPGWRLALALALGEFRQPPSSESDSLCRFCGLLWQKVAGRKYERSGQQPPSEPFRLHPGRCASSESGTCARPCLCKPQGFQAGCHRDDGSGDAQPLWGKGIAPAFSPLPVGVPVPLLLSRPRTDDASESPAYSQCPMPFEVPHPYRDEPLEITQPLRLGYAIARPCGVLQTIDIEVEDTNCYFTPSGAINRNCWLGFEELTNWPFPDFYLRTHSLVRSTTPGMPKRIRATTNSYGPGHSWIKERFIDPMPRGHRFVDPETGLSRRAIHGRLEENRILLAADPNYLAKVIASANGDPMILDAWVKGSWDIVAGGIFAGRWDRDASILEPFDIPAGWYVDRAFDWGSAKPYAVGWFAESDGTPATMSDGTVRHFKKGSVFLVSELYGWNKKANEGTGQIDSEITRAILEAEKGLKQTVLKGKTIYPGPADPNIWTKNGTGTSTATEMARLGVGWIEANNARVLGWQKLGGMMKAARQNPMEDPGFFVFSTCSQFLRTVPTMARDTKFPDDADSEQEDHMGDMVRYRVMAKPPTGVGVVKLPRVH